MILHIEKTSNSEMCLLVRDTKIYVVSFADLYRVTMIAFLQ